MSKERDKEILEILVARKQATVKELARSLFVSEPSICLVSFTVFRPWGKRISLSFLFTVKVMRCIGWSKNCCCSIEKKKTS